MTDLTDVTAAVLEAEIQVGCYRFVRSFVFCFLFLVVHVCVCVWQCSLPPNVRWLTCWCDSPRQRREERNRFRLYLAETPQSNSPHACRPCTLCTLCVCVCVNPALCCCVPCVQYGNSIAALHDQILGPEGQMLCLHSKVLCRVSP